MLTWEVLSEYSSSNCLRKMFHYMIQNYVDYINEMNIIYFLSRNLCVNFDK